MCDAKFVLVIRHLERHLTLEVNVALFTEKYLSVFVIITGFRTISNCAQHLQA